MRRQTQGSLHFHLSSDHVSDLALLPVFVFPCANALSPSLPPVQPRFLQVVCVPLSHSPTDSVLTLTHAGFSPVIVTFRTKCPWLSHTSQVPKALGGASTSSALTPTLPDATHLSQRHTTTTNIGANSYCDRPSWHGGSPLIHLGATTVFLGDGGHTTITHLHYQFFLYCI